MNCADAAKKLLKGKKAWQVRSAGQGSKGERWYAWAWIGTFSPPQPARTPSPQDRRAGFSLLLRPGGEAVSKARLIRAAGPVMAGRGELRVGKGCFGLDQCQVTALHRRPCGTSCWSWRLSRSAPSPPPSSGTAPIPRHRRPPAPHDKPRPRTPAGPAVPSREIKRLLAAALPRPGPPGHAARWLHWRRRHQALSRWFHKRARLTTKTQ